MLFGFADHANQAPPQTFTFGLPGRFAGWTRVKTIHLPQGVADRSHPCFRMIQSDHRLLGTRSLRSKTRKNPSYSLRSYARSLKMDPSDASAILNGRRPLDFKERHRSSPKWNSITLSRRRSSRALSKRKNRRTRACPTRRSLRRTRPMPTSSPAGTFRIWSAMNSSAPPENYGGLVGQSLGAVHRSGASSSPSARKSRARSKKHQGGGWTLVRAKRRRSMTSKRPRSAGPPRTISNAPSSRWMEQDEVGDRDVTGIPWPLAAKLRKPRNSSANFRRSWPHF